MTDRELMRMALDALEDVGDEWGFTSQRTLPKRMNVIEALRARLSQPEPDDGYCQACDGNNCTAKDGCVARDNPPPQREWQDLTDDESDEIWDECLGVFDCLKMTQAKLKEKNT